MQVKDFEYDLPEQLIAQQPAAERDGSRLLQLTDSGLQHGTFADVTRLLQPEDLLVVNNTKVIKARLFAQKDSGGKAELLLERVLSERVALCQVRVSKPLQAGRRLHVGDEQLLCLGRRGQFYELEFPELVLDFLDRHGHVPLPPYIHRQFGAADAQQDVQRYQTIFSRMPGAVAAPTAGLHFSDQLLASLRGAGVGLAEVTLHVGAGTYQPVRGDLASHQMHQEWYQVPADVQTQICRTRQRGGRVVAVGTTVVRSLESAALQAMHLTRQQHQGQWAFENISGFTKLFIKPGFQFQAVDSLITNFHLPGSTLLMLVSAFAGHSRVMSAYAQAVAHQYRFFSYGDAMYLDRWDHRHV